MKALKALWKNLEEVVILLIFFGMIMTVFLQVINREFIHARLNFTEELARFASALPLGVLIESDAAITLDAVATTVERSECKEKEAPVLYGSFKYYLTSINSYSREPRPSFSACSTQTFQSVFGCAKWK